MQGYVSNIQPGTAIAGFDIRLAVNENSTALLERVVNDWAPASRNVTHDVNKCISHAGSCKHDHCYVFLSVRSEVV